MAQQSRTTLKSYFETGDIPTESQFADLIDSMINIPDDGLGNTTVHSQNANTNTSGTSLQVLSDTYTLPAGSIGGDGKGVRIIAAIRLSSTADDKTFGIRFNGTDTTVLVIGNSSFDQPGNLICDIWYVDSDNARVSVMVSAGQSQASAANSAFGIAEQEIVCDFTSDIDIQIVGQSDVSGQAGLLSWVISNMS